MSPSQIREKPAGRVVHGRVHDVRGHDRLDPRPHQRRERHEVACEEIGERTLVDRQRVMRVRPHETVSRIVLADRGASAGTQAQSHAVGQMRDRMRIGTERAIADHRARAVVEVEDRA